MDKGSNFGPNDFNCRKMILGHTLPTAPIVLVSDEQEKQRRWFVGDWCRPPPHRNSLNSRGSAASSWRTLLPWGCAHGRCLSEKIHHDEKVFQVERPDHLEAWVEALELGELDPGTERQVNKNLKRLFFRWLLEGFRAGVDWPLCCWYSQLAAMHPHAKVGWWRIKMIPSIDLTNKRCC